MNKDREAKHILRAIRGTPVNQIALQMPSYEGNEGRFCLVAGELEYVDLSGERFEYTLDDPIQAALIKRYVQTRPERTHESYESALEFVRSQVSHQQL